MPEASKNVWPNVIAGIGYAVTFLSCLVGTTAVLIALGVAIVADLAVGLATGTFQQRLRKQRW